MIALVTGGSRGIGLACAKSLLAAGHSVWIAARQAEGLAAATAEEPHLQTLQLDVSQVKAVEQAFAAIQQQSGQPVQILVHAAGTEAFSPWEVETDPELWHRVMQTNLNGAYYCLRAALQQMQPTGWGRIVAIASVLGLRGMRHSHAYCASKHGLIGLVRALAQDVLADGITVNAVCPGWVQTAMAERSMSEIAAHYDLAAADFIAAELAAIPLQRWISPEEVAASVAYLVSDAAAAVSGQALEISGGL